MIYENTSTRFRTETFKASRLAKLRPGFERGSQVLGRQIGVGRYIASIALAVIMMGHTRIKRTKRMQRMNIIVERMRMRKFVFM